MYKCNDCEAVFEEPKEYAEDLTPGGVFEGGSFIKRYNACPYCGGDYDDAIQCECCGEYFTYDELEDTTEYINGGCGLCCQGCIENGDMIEM